MPTSKCRSEEKKKKLLDSRKKCKTATNVFLQGLNFLILAFFTLLLKKTCGSYGHGFSDDIHVTGFYFGNSS